jgi:hypothetical protein
MSILITTSAKTLKMNNFHGNELNILHLAVIHNRLSLLKRLVWMELFSHLDVAVRDEHSPYYALKIDAIAQRMENADAAKEICFCRQWIGSSTTLMNFDFGGTDYNLLREVDSECYTAAHWAALRGEIKIFRQIFAKVRAKEVTDMLLLKTKDNFNCLELATEMGHVELIQLLLAQLFKSDLAENECSTTQQIKSSNICVKLLEIAAKNGDIAVHKAISESV